MAWAPAKVTKSFTHQDDARLGEGRVQLSFHTKGDVFGLAVAATSSVEPTEIIFDPFSSGTTHKATKFITTLDLVGMGNYALIRSGTADGFRVARVGLDGKVTPVRVAALTAH